MASESVPDDWKEANVVPVYKGGSRNVPVSMPRRPGAGPLLADMTAPSRTASVGPAMEWKTGQLWPTTTGPAVAHSYGPLLANLHVAIIC